MADSKLNCDITLSGTDFKLESRFAYSAEKSHSNIHNTKKVVDVYPDEMVHRSVANVQKGNVPVLSSDLDLIQKQPPNLRKKRFASKKKVDSAGDIEIPPSEQWASIEDFLNRPGLAEMKRCRIWTSEVPVHQLTDVFRASYPCPAGSTLYCNNLPPHCVANTLFHILLFEKPSYVTFFNVSKFLIKGVGFLKGVCTPIKFKVHVLADGASGTCMVFTRRSADGFNFCTYVREMREALSAYFLCTSSCSSPKRFLCRVNLPEDNISTTTPSDSSADDDSVDETMRPIKDMALSRWVPHVLEALVIMCDMGKSPKNHNKLAKLTDIYQSMMSSGDVCRMYPIMVLLTSLIPSKKRFPLLEGNFAEEQLEKCVNYPHVVQEQIAKFIQAMTTNNLLSTERMTAMQPLVKRVCAYVMRQETEEEYPCEKAVCHVVCQEFDKTACLLREQVGC